MARKKGQPAPIQEAAAKYLQAVEDHAGTMLAFHEGLMQFEPEAPEVYKYLLYNADRYFQVWKFQVARLRKHSEDGQVCLLSLKRIVQILADGDTECEWSWIVLDQLIYLHGEYQRGALNEDKQQELRDLNPASQAAQQQLIHRTQAHNALRDAFIENPEDVDIRLRMQEIHKAYERLKVEKEEREAREQAEPRRHSVASIARDTGISKSTITRCARTLIVDHKIIQETQQGRVQRFTDLERDEIIKRCAERGQEKTQRKIKSAK